LGRPHEAALGVTEHVPSQPTRISPSATRRKLIGLLPRERPRLDCRINRDAALGGGSGGEEGKPAHICIEPSVELVLVDADLRPTLSAGCRDRQADERFSR
jgi:hypothetical protein